MSTNTQHPSAVTFRKDINGLRAWAVIVVVLFHFGVPGFAGGFVGVDVFFVISGFLMTNILIKKLENSHQKFSVWDFYLARAKRIIPALLALCFALLALGWFMLPPQDYRSLGMHTLTSVLFGGMAVLFTAPALAVGRMATVAWPHLCGPVVVAGLAAVIGSFSLAHRTKARGCFLFIAHPRLGNADRWARGFARWRGEGTPQVKGPGARR